MQHKFIDSIVEYSPEKIVGKKQLSSKDEVFRDHFPSFPIFPAAMMVESSVRLMQIHSLKSSNFERIFIPYLYKNFKFYSHLNPGDLVFFSNFLSEFYKKSDGGKVTCKSQGFGKSKIFSGEIVGYYFPFIDFSDEHYFETEDFDV